MADFAGFFVARQSGAADRGAVACETKPIVRGKQADAGGLKTKPARHRLELPLLAADSDLVFDVALAAKRSQFPGISSPFSDTRVLPAIRIPGAAPSEMPSDG